MQMQKRHFNRRRFLGGAAAGAGAYALLGGPAILTSRGQVGSDGSFTQSVASSQPTDNGISLWTRVEDLGGAQRVELEIARDEGFSNVVHRENVNVASANPIAKTRVGGLDTGERYFYRFSTGSEDSPVGRFSTARGDSRAEPVKIAFFSCEEYIAGFYHAHRDLAMQEDIDLVVCLGDYIYERAFDTLPVREDDTGDGGEVQRLAEYRAKYDLYHSDENLLKVRQSFPLMTIWDDHEVEDNYAEMRPGGATMNRRIPFRQRMANGYRSFFEYMPQMPFGGQDNRIFGSLKLGGNAELFLLDTRQFRDNQVCNPTDQFFSLGCPPSEYNRPGRTLLGDRQQQWLKDSLASSDANWKVVANQVMIMSLDVPTPRQPFNSDSWDGYGDERRELIDFIGEQEIENVTFVTGDIHTFFAGNVTRSGREAAPSSPGAPAGTGTGSDESFVIADGPSRATEFVGGSITTAGIADRVPEEDPRFGTAALADAGVMANNPHIKFSCQAYKGYGILTAGADELTVEYRAVRDHKDRNDTCVFRIASFTVQSGVPEIPESQRGECPPPEAALLQGCQPPPPPSQP